MIALIMDMMEELETVFLPITHNMHVSLMIVNALIIPVAPAAVGQARDVVRVVVPALKGFKHNHAAQVVAHQNHDVLLIQVAATSALQANGLAHQPAQNAHQMAITILRAATGVQAEIHGVHAS